MVYIPPGLSAEEKELLFNRIEEDLRAREEGVRRYEATVAERERVVREREQLQRSIGQQSSTPIFTPVPTVVAPVQLPVIAAPAVSSPAPARPPLRREPVRQRRATSLPQKRLQKRQRAAPTPRAPAPTLGRRQRCTSAYNVFFRENSGRFVAMARQHPEFLDGGADCRTISLRLMSAEWNAMEDKSEWVQKAEAINQQHRVEVVQAEQEEEQGEGEIALDGEEGGGDEEDQETDGMGTRARRGSQHIRNRGGFDDQY